MGKNIDKMSLDEVRVDLENKVDDYAKLMSFYCTTEEVENKKQSLKEKINKINYEYFTSKSINDKDTKKEEMNDEMSRIYADEMSKYKIARSTLDYLLNDEKFFLNFFISSGPKSRGVLFLEENGNVLYKGINEALCENVLSVMELEKLKEGKEFNYTKEIEDDDKPLRQPLSKDEVVIALSNERFIGKDLYRFFFTGDGMSFHNAMNSIMKPETIIKFNKSIDDSVFDNNNELYKFFEDVCLEVMNYNSTLKTVKNY